MTPSDEDSSTDLGRPLLIEAAQEFMEDRALRLGASLAYYGLITLAPLLILLLGISGLLFAAWKGALDVIWGIGYRSGVEATLRRQNLAMSGRGESGPEGLIPQQRQIEWA